VRCALTCVSCLHLLRCSSQISQTLWTSHGRSRPVHMVNNTKRNIWIYGGERQRDALQCLAVWRRTQILLFCDLRHLVDSFALFFGIINHHLLVDKHARTFFRLFPTLSWSSMGPFGSICCLLASSPGLVKTRNKNLRTRRRLYRFYYDTSTEQLCGWFFSCHLRSWILSCCHPAKRKSPAGPEFASRFQQGRP